MRLNNRQKTLFWIALFLVPSVMLYLLIYAYPIAAITVTSFCEWTSTKSLKFIGLDNYKYLLAKDNPMWIALRNTSIWMVLQCTIHVGLGILVAFVLAKKPFGWKVARSVYVIPNIISPVALGVLYLNMFNPQIGIINGIIRGIGFKNFNVNWFAQPETAFIGVTLTWLVYAALMSLIVSAEIASIPDSILEAAEIDGASSFQKDRFIILPMLKNVVGTCMILAATSMITSFDTIFITTRGGPNNATLNIGLYLYKIASLENNYALANTIGVVQLVFGLVVIFIVQRLFSMNKS